MSFGVSKHNRPPSDFPVPIPYRDTDPATYDEKIHEGSVEKDAIKEFREHILAISSDHRGSDPEDYLSPTDYSTLMNFVDLADHVGWPGAQSIGLKKHRVHYGSGGRHLGFKAWNASPRQPDRNGLMQAIMLRKAGQKHRGYIFGRLAVGDPHQMVAIADDGRLYSQREMDGTQKSYGKGWGRLPDPEIIEPVLAPGQLYGVDTKAFRKPMLRCV